MRLTVILHCEKEFKFHHMYENPIFSKLYLRDIYKVSTMCQTLLQATEQEGQGSI